MLGRSTGFLQSAAYFSGGEPAFGATSRGVIEPLKSLRGKAATLGANFRGDHFSSRPTIRSRPAGVFKPQPPGSPLQVSQANHNRVKIFYETLR